MQFENQLNEVYFFLITLKYQLWIVNWSIVCGWDRISCDVAGYKLEMPNIEQFQDIAQLLHHQLHNSAVSYRDTNENETSSISWDRPIDNKNDSDFVFINYFSYSDRYLYFLF